MGEDPLSLRASGTKPKVSEPRGSSPTGSPHSHVVLHRTVCQDHSTAMKPLKSHSCGHGNKEDAEQEVFHHRLKGLPERGGKGALGEGVKSGFGG